MNSFKFRGHNVNYLATGPADAQPMIFLHNGGSGHWIWKYQTDHFSKTHRVIAFDMIGCGSSDRPRMNYDLPMYTGMLADFMEQKNIRDAVLVGNCIGAAIALEYCTRCADRKADRTTDRVSALVLMNVCGGLLMMTPKVRMVSVGSSFPKFLEPLQIAMLKFFAKIPGTLKEAVHTNYGGRPNPNDFVYQAELKSALNPNQTYPRLDFIRGIPTFNKFSLEFERPANLPPIYLFWGAANKIMPLKNGKKFAARLKPDREMHIPGTGHFMASEAHEIVNREIDDFLKRARSN